MALTSREAALTDPETVPEFVRRTGIDALAVAIGTAHGFYKDPPQLDFPRLDRIRSLTSVLLVLHGGTGLTDEDFTRSIRRGMSKINVGTELKYCCSQTARKNMAAMPDQIDIRKLVGQARDNCREIVEKRSTSSAALEKREADSPPAPRVKSHGPRLFAVHGIFVGFRRRSP